MTIMVFKKDKIFPDGIFQGFLNYYERSIEEEIIPHLKEMRRGDAESDPSHKQPIPYIMIVNPNEKTIFIYQRASDKNYAHESRLHGKLSWGIGGHVEPGGNNPKQN